MNAPSRVTVVDSIVLFVVALGIRLAAFQFGAEPQAVELPGRALGADLLTGRLVSLAMSSLAPVLLAHAGERLGGRFPGLLAGGLLALSPWAVEHAAWAGATSPLVFAASAALLCLLVWVEDRRPAAIVGFVLFGALVVAPQLGGRLALASLAALPSAHDPRLASPLLTALGRVREVAGPTMSLLAVATVVNAFIGWNSRRTIFPIFGFALVVLGTTLVRLGPSREALSAIIPAVALLTAAMVEFRRATNDPKKRLAVRFVAIPLLLIAVIFTTQRIVAARVAPPAQQAAEWIRDNLPDQTALLAEAGALRWDALDEVVRQRALRIIPLPPPTAGAAIERSLFYDPNLAGVVPWMVLGDLPSETPPEDEPLVNVRRNFHETFLAEWQPAARFETGRSRRPGVTILQRPEGWALDRDAISAKFSTLAGPARTQLREESRAFRDWVLDAGIRLRETGEVEGARFLVDIAHARDSTSAETNFQRALLQILENDLEGARISLLTGLADDATHGGIHYNLGTLFEAEGDILGAAVEYGAAVRFLENPVPAHVRLGVLLAAQGQIEEARPHLEAVRRLAPGSEAERALAARLGGS